jgi:hypothetical protein
MEKWQIFSASAISGRSVVRLGPTLFFKDQSAFFSSAGSSIFFVKKDRN